MRVHLNGKEHTVSGPVTISGLLTELGLTGHRLAVEVNHEIIPASRHTQVLLAENDRVEIIHAVGGG